MAEILVLYYSAYGHCQAMAEAAAAAVEGSARLRRIPEWNEEVPAAASDPVSSSAGVASSFGSRRERYETQREHQTGTPEAELEDLRRADGLVLAFPTYYGMMPSQVKFFLEKAGSLCADGSMEGKPAGVITSAGSIHTGHESTLLTTMVPLLHFGFVLVGLPYTQNPEYLTADAVGGTPYGASTLAGPDSSRTPDPRELLFAGRLAENVHRIARGLELVRAEAE
ncbi:NAD(P)H:quinone oxidoreductase [Alkalicoccus urumqiensis]|uniref:NAD(P)H:quinone oxidoreductase n=1 Tax=Alkalicoccus urumqiensis TaxID=1548213 RepID=A0A2P6MJJ2_ALKUR|nr:NAD(P)H:quinone oxidoreductase [Alkalicoccus urumqiensis]PRO66435.1 NAD(P)H:quinone oxidoreductase [Alkalicoccus urumqiensis]